MQQQFRDRDRRLGSLEQSRDSYQDFWTYLPLVVALVVLIVVVTAAIASREQRQDADEPRQRSPSSFHAPPLGTGFADDGDTPLGFLRPRNDDPGAGVGLPHDWGIDRGQVFHVLWAHISPLRGPIGN